MPNLIDFRKSAIVSHATLLKSFSGLMLGFCGALVIGATPGVSLAQVPLLDSTSTKIRGEVHLPKQELAYLPIKRGLDPYSIFNGGMNTSLQNPLHIENRDDLWLSIGGIDFLTTQEYINDGDVTALEFSAKAQRFFIASPDANSHPQKNSYQLVVNIDRKEKNARVWSRVFDNGWKPWALTAEYGK
jgi:hypothetical protein